MFMKFWIFLISCLFQESISLNSSLQLVSKDKNAKNPLQAENELCTEDGKENKVCTNKEQQPFPCEKDRLTRKMRGKNENYRRLKMKKSYVHGTSVAKKSFRKWRRNRKKR